MFRLGAPRRLLPAVLTAVVLFWTGSSAQYLNNVVIPDQETLEWLFETGLIDQDELDRWSELFIDSLREDSPPDDSLPYSRTRTPRFRANSAGIRAGYKIYQNAADDSPYRHLGNLKAMTQGGFYCHASLERFADGRFQLRERTIGWRRDDTDIRLGGLDPNWCGGLVLGRHPIFLQHKDAARSLLYPVKSRFNGAGIETRYRKFTVSVLSSHDRDTRFSATVHGGQVGFRRGSMAANVSIIRGSIRNRDDYRTGRVAVAGGGVGMKSRKVAWSFDLASDGGRNRAYLAHVESEGKRHEVYIWHYDSDFINPFGAGRANSDTYPVEMPEIDLVFRSRYACETGVQTRATCPLAGSLLLTIESNWWTTGSTQKFRLRAAIAAERNRWRVLRLVLLAGDDDLGAPCGDFYSALAEYRLRIDPKRSIFFSSRWKASEAAWSTAISYQLETRMAAKRMGHDTELCLRWYDPDSERSRDHHLYCFLKESILVGDAVCISVAISSRFGPGQSVLEKTRMSFETTARF